MKIVLSVAVALLLMGCSDEKSQTAQKEITQSVQKVAAVVKTESKNIVKSVDVATEDSVKVVTKKAKEVSENINKTTQTALTETKKVIKKTAHSIDKAIEEPKKVPAPKVVAVPTVDGSAIFTKCSGCHGVHADKKALNKSAIIKGWSVAKLTAAINGYKDGSYGSSMKGVMKPQVSKLSDAEVHAVAEHISKL